MKRVIVYARRENGRSRHVAEAMVDGFKRHGRAVDVEIGFSGVRGDLAVAYGWNHRHVFEAYRRAGAHFLYVDLGFWDRKPAGRPRDGYHKVVLDSWCPAEKMRRGCPDDRFRRLKIEVRSQAQGDKIVVAGMSAKSARDHGLAPHQWEARVIRELRSVSERPIMYRAKPSWDGARPIAGAEFADKETPIVDVLADAHAVITHHSNVAVDAAAAGLPIYCEKGVGKLLSMERIADVEPARPVSESARRALLADIAYLQWMPQEMRTGECWEHTRGLL